MPLRDDGDEGRSVRNQCAAALIVSSRRRDVASFGTIAQFARPLGFRAVWNSAPFGIQRPLEFSAPVALRRYAFRARDAGVIPRTLGIMFQSPFPSFHVRPPPW